MENKKILRSALIGFALWLVGAVVTGLLFIFNIIDGGVGVIDGRQYAYGPMAAIGYFVTMWDPTLLRHEVAYPAVVLVLVAITLFIATIVMAIAKKKPAFLMSAITEAVSIGFLAFVIILVSPMAQLGAIKPIPFMVMCGVTCLMLAAIVLGTAPVIGQFFNAANRAAGFKKEENCCCEGEEGLGEEQVKAIVKEGIDAHVEEYHSEDEKPAPVPVKNEKEPEPEPELDEESEEEDEEEEEEGEEETAPNEADAQGLVIKGKRKRASFETRLRNSDFDMRHKYYDLRDYIKWYGLRNRVSIPGDTFSYKRQRYIFVTIVGKHIRVYYALDPKDYADSTIPVEASEAKKYEDLPCLLRVKSDLAYRRAKKLVDDMMAKIGIEKPDEEEPKETQNQD